MAGRACRRGRWVALLLLVLAAPAGFAAGLPPREHVVVLNCAEETASKAFLAELATHGGVVRHLFPPHVVIAALSDAAAQDLAQDPRVAAVTSHYLDPAAVPEAYGPFAREAVSAWNQVYVLAPSPVPESAEAISGEPLAQDVLLSPSHAIRQAEGGAPQVSPFGAASWQTSAFLMGSTTISLIFPESNGAIDTNTEDWTDPERSTVIAKALTGANSWVARYPYTASPLSFTWVASQTVATGYEPITHASYSEEGLWIAQIMTALGHPATPSNYWWAVQAYDNELRNSQGTDWAFTVFVVNSVADTDGEFTDGRFAYAYLGGPFVVMTYDNDGWGISRMDSVLAHEMGHIYDAGDEYCQPGYACCDGSQYYGYLHIQNTNCSSGVPCIMLDNSNVVCSVTAQQLGWRDTDADGVPDILGVPPTATLTPHLPDPTADQTPSYTGSASVQTYPNQSDPGADCTVSRLAGVQYRVDGGAWQEAAASDGAFDEATEAFSFTPAALSLGPHTLEVRALDTAGNWTPAPYGSDTLTITDVHSVTVTAAATPAVVGSRQSTALRGTANDTAEHSIASWSWSDGGAGGSFAPSSAAQNPSYTAPSNTSGSDLSVTLTASATCGGPAPTSGSGSCTLTVHSGPAADFSATPTTGSIPLTVSFTDLSAHSPASWAWDFGDGGSSVLQNPTHVYSTAEVYTVSLTVTNAGGSDTKTLTNYIHALVPRPVADFWASPLQGPAPLRVSFYDASTNAPDTWYWDFGDGGTDTVPYPTHRYASQGRYTVSLTAQNNGGADTMTKTDYIVVDPPAPVPALSGTPRRGHAPLEVSFSDLSTGARDSWLWEFGDGATSLEANPIHTYQAPGRYSVALTVGNGPTTARATQSDYVFASFTDVPISPPDTQDYWALTEILACVDAGVVKGYKDGSYQPRGEVTRAQMAVYIARAKCGGDASVPSGPATATFSDVPKGYWAYNAIEYAVTAEVVTGYKDGTYKPELVLNRGQMAVFLARAMCGGEAKVPDLPGGPSFSDVDPSFWAYKHIEYIRAASVTTGYADGTYHPEYSCLRDQMATFVTRAFVLW